MSKGWERVGKGGAVEVCKAVIILFNKGCTMVQNRNKHKIKSIIHCPTSSGVSERAVRTDERVAKYSPPDFWLFCPTVGWWPGSDFALFGSRL